MLTFKHTPNYKDTSGDTYIYIHYSYTYLYAITHLHTQEHLQMHNIFTDIETYLHALIHIHLKLLAFI